MIVAPTEDRALVRSIVTHPAVWPHISDDGCDTVAFEPVIGPNVVNLLAREGDFPGGLWVYHRHNAITWEVHTCVLPGHYGGWALEAARSTLRWMVGNTDCRKVVTHVPAPNRRAYRFALRVGLTDEGTNRGSFLKGGAVLDQHVLGITKEEIECL